MIDFACYLFVDIIAPMFYFMAQACILTPITIGHFTASSVNHPEQLAFLGLVTILALIYYLRAACTNPGYLIGSLLDVA